jgi:hypothetical protein
MSVEVHPFGAVTVKVYVPVRLTFGLVVAESVIVAPAGPVHNKVAPAVAEAPYNVTCEAMHVSIAGFLSTIISGGVIFEVTVTFCDTEQPLMLLVMVSVYIPALVTIASKLAVDPVIVPSTVVHNAV